MTPKNKSAGKYKGFPDNWILFETTCLAAQTKKRTAAPASNAKVAHSSTAPNAKIAKIKEAHKAPTSTDCKNSGARLCGCSRSMESAVSISVYDEIFNLPILS
jgi:hypothetical protein